MPDVLRRDRKYNERVFRMLVRGSGHAQVADAPSPPQEQTPQGPVASIVSPVGPEAPADIKYNLAPGSHGVQCI